MFALYVIIAAIILAYSFYYAGQWERPERGAFFAGARSAALGKILI